MMLSQDEQTALQFFADGPTQVSALFTTFSRTRSYKLVRRLCSKGALRKVGANRELTPGGRALLTPVTPADTWITAAPGLEAAIPHLRHAPTPHHKAFLSLGLCARVARLHRLRESHHPALLAAGPPARFKTWGGKALILMCGGDPSADVVYLGIESGRSLVSRKKSDGTRATLRAALTRPAVVLDEWLRAKLDVRKLVELYLFGELAVADEDGQLEVLAVPVVTLNPRDGKSLEQQLGLDEAMLRRAIVFVLDDVAIPDELLASGDDLLEAIRDLGPVETPAPRFPELDARGDVQRILTDALDDRSRLARIDITMLSMLVTAAT